MPPLGEDLFLKRLSDIRGTLRVMRHVADHPALARALEATEEAYRAASIDRHEKDLPHRMRTLRRELQTAIEEVPAFREMLGGALVVDYARIRCGEEERHATAEEAIAAVRRRLDWRVLALRAALVKLHGEPERTPSRLVEEWRLEKHGAALARSFGHKGDIEGSMGGPSYHALVDAERRRRTGRGLPRWRNRQARDDFSNGALDRCDVRSYEVGVGETGRRMRR